MEFLQTVNVQATNDVEIGRKVRAIKRIAAEPIETNEPTDEEDKPADPPPPSPPPAPVPYFEIGEATGKPGETVTVPVRAGCQYPMDGFHLIGGVGLLPEERSGYGKFRAFGVELGALLTQYLTAKDMIHDKPDHEEEHFFSTFNFVDWKQRALPEEWWQYGFALLSIDQKRLLKPFPLPHDTELFRLKIEILPNTQPGVYKLTCKDKWYYTQSNRWRRDITYTYSPQGFTKVDTFPGKITVIA